MLENVLLGKNKPLLALGEGVGEPVKTLVETITSGGRRALDVPLAVAELVKTEALSDLLNLHGVGEILLVGENKEDGIAKLIFREHAVDLILRTVLIVLAIVNTLTIVRIDDEDNSLGVLVVVAPERADLILTSDIPNGERDVLILNSLNVETNGGNGGNNVTELELVKNGGLTSSIETNHQDTHLLLAEHTRPKLGECLTHFGYYRKKITSAVRCEKEGYLNS
jgi:hypothetical protein